MKTTIVPYIFYRDVSAALQWLSQAFGFKEELRIALPDGRMHAEMSLDGQRVMMGLRQKQLDDASPRQTGTATMGVFIWLDNVDIHYARARAAGAKIESPPRDEAYGRTYTAIDLDGHPWFFTTPPESEIE